MDAKAIPEAGSGLRPAPGSKAIHLDTDSVLRLPSPSKGSALHFDDEIPGFHVQVTYTGTKTFRLRYRKTVDGNTRWYSVKIGRWRPRGAPRLYARTDADKKRAGITAGEARAAAAAIRRDIDAGQNPALEIKLRDAEQVKAARGAVLLAAAFKEYLSYARNRAKPMEPGSIAQVERSFNNHVLPRLGNRYMSSLTSEDVEELATETGKGKATRKGRKVGGPSAAKHVIAHLSAFLAWAVKKKILTENVAKQIDRADVLAADKPRKRYLSREEWAALMHELDERPFWATRGSRFSATKTVRLGEPQLRQLVSCEALRVALLTGSRKGEVLSLRWRDVDLDGGWWIKPKVKGGKQHEIALPKLAVESLRRLKGGHGDPVFAFPGKARLDAITAGRRLNGEEGGHIRDVHELWGRIRADLGMPDVTIHDLRHTAASVLISTGASLYDVGQQLGHSQAQTTQRYAHLFEERKRELAGMMDAFAERNPKKPARRSTADRA